MLNNNFKINRFPNRAYRMRGPDMEKRFCQCCGQDKTHGFSFVEFVHAMNPCHLSIFICDDCLNEAKKNK